MYRSFRSATRTVSSTRLLHSSPRCLDTVQTNPAPSKSGGSSTGKEGAGPGGEPVLSGRLREATSLLRGCITKAAGDSAISIRKRADRFTVVTQTLFSELGGQLNRATGYEEIELLKKKVQEQGVSFSQVFQFVSTHVDLPSKFVLTRVQDKRCSWDGANRETGLRGSRDQAVQLPTRSQRASPTKAHMDRCRRWEIHYACPRGPFV